MIACTPISRWLSPSALAKVGIHVGMLIIAIGMAGDIHLRAETGLERAVSFRSVDQCTPLIELFTSEGCSSCPPADRWLAGLARSGRLWKDFIPVAWHVDYWDQLGWVDRLATPGNTRRQESYSRVWKGRGMYTPGLVVNGREWRDWNPSVSLPTVIKDQVGILELKSKTPGEFDLSFQPVPAFMESAQSEAMEATIVWLGSGIESSVRRGENAGATLRHSFVVLSSTSAPLARVVTAASNGGPTSVPTWVARIRLSPPAKSMPRPAVAAWISRVGNPVPLQAVGGEWPALP